MPRASPVVFDLAGACRAGHSLRNPAVRIDAGVAAAHMLSLGTPHFARALPVRAQPLANTANRDSLAPWAQQACVMANGVLRQMPEKWRGGVALFELSILFDAHGPPVFARPAGCHATCVPPQTCHAAAPFRVSAAMHVASRVCSQVAADDVGEASSHGLTGLEARPLKFVLGEGGAKEHWSYLGRLARLRNVA